jgi:DNA helicase-2/ATP-dependent DNA helicase PcrA
VTLSTVHRAKGLEWRVVFVIGLCDGSFPLPSLPGDPPGRLDEERRLFYVAVTRARDQLYLCQPLAGARGALAPSRLLAELPLELIDRWELCDG